MALSWGVGALGWDEGTEAGERNGMDSSPLLVSRA